MTARHLVPRWTPNHKNGQRKERTAAWSPPAMLLRNRRPQVTIGRSHPWQSLRAGWPQPVFAPLVDIGLSAASGPFPQFDMVAATQNLGVRFFQLGHVTADTNQQPIFGGYRLGSRWDEGLRTHIAALRRAGEMFRSPLAAPTVPTLSWPVRSAPHRRWCAATRKLSKPTVCPESISHCTDPRSTSLSRSKRRWCALTELQHLRAAAGHPLAVWFTLTATPRGLPAGEMHLIRSALAAHLELAGVNLALGNFGQAAAPQPEGSMGRRDRCRTTGVRAVARRTGSWRRTTRCGRLVPHGAHAPDRTKRRAHRAVLSGRRRRAVGVCRATEGGPALDGLDQSGREHGTGELRFNGH